MPFAPDQGALHEDRRMIEFQNASHNYGGGVFSVQDLSVVFRKGETVALLGDNGAGKSTVAMLANGLLKPVSGRVLVDGLDTSDEGSLREIRKKVGLVFQNPDSQFVATTVEREIAFGLENLGVGLQEMHRRVDEWLRAFGILYLKDRSPRDLSEGEKALVAVASVMVLEPEYIVLDEPTSHLDAAESRRLFSLIERRGQDSGKIVISRKSDEVDLCDRAVTIEFGRKVFDGKLSGVSGSQLAPTGLASLAGELRDTGLPVPDNPGSIQELVHSVLEARGRLLQRVPQGTSPTRGLAPREPRFESLSLVDASYTYMRGLPGERTAVRDARVTARRGGFLGVAGPNGSGKTTLALMLSGLLEPDSGSFEARGRDGQVVKDRRAVRREIGFVFQNPEHAFFTETCLAEVLYGAKNFRVDEPEERAVSALNLVGLGDETYRARSPFEMSHGEQRRLAIACALAHDPSVVFMDEPTAGLDWKGRELVRRILGELRASGRTAVIVSHDPGLILDLADSLVYLEAGRIVHAVDPRVPLAPALFQALAAGGSGISEVLAALRSSGLEVETALLSPRRAAQSILRALGSSPGR